MTKKEAIWWVNHLFEISKEEYFNKGMIEDAKEVEEAQHMAIEALSAEADDRLYIKVYADDEPSVKAEKLYQICGETENRETAEWLKEYFPSAEAVQGEWIDTEFLKLKECSCCHNRWGVYSIEEFDFCPSCGARMKPYKGGDIE